MIRSILIILVLLTSLAVGPLLLDTKGYILISVYNTIYELSVYAALFWITAISICLFLTIKIFRGGLNFSFGTWNRISGAAQRRGIANFNKGLAAYMLEDYSQAEELFAKSAIPSKRKQSAYLLAASASAKQGLDSNINHYLALLEQETINIKDLGLESVLVNIKLLMNQDKAETYAKARELIDLNHKLIGHDSRLLTLEIDLCLIEQRFTQAVEYLTAARKNKSITDEKITAWEADAYYGSFTDSIKRHDTNDLQNNWNGLGRKVKQREAVVLAYCKVLAENNIVETLNDILVPIFKKSASKDFLKTIRELPILHADKLIALAQKQLQQNIHSGKWLSCLGHLALSSKQYPMAEKAFGSLIKLEGEGYGIQHDRQDLQAFAQVYSKQGLYQAADAMWAKANAL